MVSVAPPRGPARILAALSTLTTPLLPEDFAELFNPLWSTSELRGRVVEVRTETERAATVRIRPGRGWAGHRAGQYVPLGVDVEGVRHWRTYSLTSTPSDPCLSITVQALPGGVVSNHLVHSSAVGQIVHLKPAAGDFVLPDPVPDRLLMISAGSGITPVMAMLRTLAERGALPDIVLVHSAPTSADVIFADELEAFGGLGLRVIARITRSQGRLSLVELDTLCPDWREREALVCGPAGLLDDAAAHWVQHPGRLRIERFTTPARAGGGTGGTVGFGTIATVTVDAQTSLLEAGEAAGVPLPSGCRMGICFGCVLPLRAGQVRDLRTGRVHGEPGDLIQTCISGASGDAYVDTPTSSRSPR
jgi:ferredoxin-NADP reductase